MLVSLYTSRVVLEQLGVEDYGIYNVIGGLVAMFSIMSGALSAAISRFLTFELGRKNNDRLRTIFSTSVNVQLIMGLVIVLLIEIGGVWFLNNKMEIPAGRLNAATVVLHVSMITFLINLISVPYNATIIAHERMGAFAYIAMLEAVMKLGVAYLITLSPIDKLIVYACLLLGVSLVVRLVFSIYCNRHFEECKYQLKLDKPLLKEMLTFASWNFIGSSSGMLKSQGINILLNVFFGTVVNAAQGIASQVRVAINSFVTNFITAMNPQITKSYALENREYMSQLVFSGSKYGFYLLLILALPIFFETKQILSLWLTVVPDFTVVFIRLMLVESLVESLSQTIITAMAATGDIKKYQITVGGIYLLNLPMAYFLLMLGLAPESVFATTILVAIFALCGRVVFFRRMSLSRIQFLKQVITKVLVVTILSIIAPIIIYYTMEPSISRLVTVTILGEMFLLLSIYTLGLSRNERETVNGYIKNKIRRSQFKR